MEEIVEGNVVEDNAEHAGEMTIEINREFIADMLEFAEQKYPDMNLIEVAVHFQVGSDLIKKQFNIQIGD